jgi:hypothetical protein
MLKQRTVIGVGVVTTLVLAVCLTIGVFSYGITRKQWDGPATRAFANLVSFPVGRVDGHKATYSDYLAQVDAQAIYLKTEDARTRKLPSEVNAQTREAAYSQLIQIAALEALADQEKISITDLDVDRAFSDFENQSGTSTQPGEIDNFLRESFGWSRDEFKRFFIRPGVLSQALRLKMPGATEDEKAQALSKKIDERLAEGDVKRYLILAR